RGGQLQRAVEQQSVPASEYVRRLGGRAQVADGALRQKPQDAALMTLEPGVTAADLALVDQRGPTGRQAIGQLELRAFVRSEQLGDVGEIDLAQRLLQRREQVRTEAQCLLRGAHAQLRQGQVPRSVRVEVRCV